MAPIISFGEAHLCPRIKFFVFCLWMQRSQIVVGMLRERNVHFRHFALCSNAILVAARPLPPLPRLIPKAVYPSVNLSFYLPLFDILPYLNKVSTAWVPALW